MKRRLLVDRVSAALEGRRLVWFGTRGDDVESAVELPELGAAFSIISAYGRRESVPSRSLEDLTRSRVDLDAYELDDHLDEPAVRELRGAVFTALAGRSAVFTYRPSTFLSAICFARRDRTRYLGMFKDHQSAFEHKPWVECAVADFGVPHIPWTYVADEDQLETLKMLRDGPVMLRRSRTSGGSGLVKLEDREDLRDAWLSSKEAYVSVAPFVEGGVPVNIGAVVWADGVTVHPASVQLIGQQALTNRAFGYCGNDFSAVRQLPAETVVAMEDATRITGEWLRSRGYVGAFGIDFLVKDGLPLFTEVNPRFQGSTHASCQISVERDESCLLVDHLAACLGLPAYESAPLLVQVREAPELSHVVLHNTAAGPVHADVPSMVTMLGQVDEYCRTDVLPPRGVPVDRGATLARLTLRRGVTSTGFDLTPDLLELAESVSRTTIPHPEHA